MPTLPDEVAFISGVYPDGTLPLDCYAAWNDGTIPADYGGGYTLTAKWGAPTAGTPGGTVYYYFDPASSWSTAEQNWLASGLALWSAVANISFVATATAAQAQITFTRGTSGAATSSSYTYSSPDAARTGGSILATFASATISINTNSNGFGPISAFSTKGGYPIMTFLHEEGHALGLGHAGPYNSTVTESTQQYSPYDTRLWTIMSYIDPGTTSAKYYAQYPVTDTYWGSSGGYGRRPVTWMPLDILALQALYGTPTSTPLSGGQVFGFNCNVDASIKSFFDFTVNTNPVVTLWDAGTGNVLDISGWLTGSAMNLNPGTYSSCDGLTNNIAIAFGTAIDTLVCGLGSDTVLCNADGDTVYGGGGNDTITGGSGNDTLSGGSGTNSLNGGGGLNTALYSGNYASYTIVANGSGGYTITGNSATDTLTNIRYAMFADRTVALGLGISRDFNGDGKSDILWENTATGQDMIWLMDGTTRTSMANAGGAQGAEWKIISTGDFNGDGKADILWEDPSRGQDMIWLMNGATRTTMAAAGGSQGSVWKIIGTGDFDGDGKSDILWEDTTRGQDMIWLMNGTTRTTMAAAGGSQGAEWKIVGTGDFNGDGKSDILWENTTNGQDMIWLMNGTTRTAMVSAGGAQGAEWKIIGTGDFNGDGKSDILWENTNNGQDMIWLMNGTTRTSMASAGGPQGAGWTIVGTGDYNGDGKSDILWEYTATGQDMIWLMNGTTRTAMTSAGGAQGSAWLIVGGT